MIENGRRVSIEYTLTLADGTTADSNVGEEPLIYQHGEEEILPILEQALVGLAVGDTKQITLSPEEGYGERDPELLQEVRTEQVPEEARTAGAQLLSHGQGGEQRVVVVHEVNPDHVVLDFNHPLAGETLQFAVKIIAVE